MYKNIKRPGKLIVIEGSDGCGKNTQSKLLTNRLNNIGIRSRLISFPNYDSLSSGPIQMYLRGELGGVYDVNFRQASVLYAVDRFCTFRKEKINELLDDGWYIICDRYVISNMIHQAAKHYGNTMVINLIIDWISNLEYHDLKLPEPDHVFFLDVRPEVSAKLRGERLNNIESSVNGSVDRSKDIHEIDSDFMTKSYLNGLDLAKKLGWDVIDCNIHDENNNITIKSVDDIHQNIYYHFNQWLRNIK